RRSHHYSLSYFSTVYSFPIPEPALLCVDFVFALIFVQSDAYRVIRDIFCRIQTDVELGKIRTEVESNLFGLFYTVITPRFIFQFKYRAQWSSGNGIVGNIIFRHIEAVVFPYSGSSGSPAIAYVIGVVALTVVYVVISRSFYVFAIPFVNHRFVCSFQPNIYPARQGTSGYSRQGFPLSCRSVNPESNLVVFPSIVVCALWNKPRIGNHIAFRFWIYTIYYSGVF